MFVVAQGLDRYVKKKKLDPLDTYVPLVLEARDVLAELDTVMGEPCNTIHASALVCNTCAQHAQQVQPSTAVCCRHVTLDCCTCDMAMLAASQEVALAHRCQASRHCHPARCCLPAVKEPSAARQLLRSGPFRGMRDNIRALGQYAALPAAEGGAGLSESDAGQLVSGFFQALEGYDLLLYNAVREYKQQEQKAAKNSSSDEDAEASAAAAVDPAVGLDKAAAAEKLQLTVQKLDQLIATVPADVLAKSQQVLAKVTGKKVPVAAEAS